MSYLRCWLWWFWCILALSYLQCCLWWFWCILAQCLTYDVVSDGSGVYWHNVLPTMLFVMVLVYTGTMSYLRCCLWWFWCILAQCLTYDVVRGGSGVYWHNVLPMMLIVMVLVYTGTVLPTMLFVMVLVYTSTMSYLRCCLWWFWCIPALSYLRCCLWWFWCILAQCLTYDVVRGGSGTYWHNILPTMLFLIGRMRNCGMSDVMWLLLRWVFRQCTNSDIWSQARIAWWKSEIKSQVCQDYCQ